MEKKRKDPPASQLSNMEYGTKNEINAVATLVGRILPFLYPDLAYVEEGCYVEYVDQLNSKPLIVVSPDGSIRNGAHKKAILGFEAK